MDGALRQECFESCFKHFLCGPGPGERTFGGRSLHQFVLAAAGDRRMPSEELSQDRRLHAVLPLERAGGTAREPLVIFSGPGDEITDFSLCKWCTHVPV